jgi:hypothetical protein
MDVAVWLRGYGTATTYARLTRDQVAPVYGWFIGGFGTKDLKEAKALLEELAVAPTLAASASFAVPGRET